MRFSNQYKRTATTAMLMKAKFVMIGKKYSTSCSPVLSALTSTLVRQSAERHRYTCMALGSDIRVQAGFCVGAAAEEEGVDGGDMVVRYMWECEVSGRLTGCMYASHRASLRE